MSTLALVALLSAAPPEEAAPESPAHTLLAPKRATGFALAASLRVGIPVAFSVLTPTVHAGVFGALEGSLTWRAEGPFSVRARLWPLTASTGGSGVLAAASLDVALDGRYAAVGFGAGVGFGTEPRPGPAATAQPVLAGLARFGATDGLNVSGQVSFKNGPLAYRTTGFSLYAVEVQLQVPIGRGNSLQLRGAGPYRVGSEYSFLSVELGARLALGADRRLFLTPSLGFGGFLFGGPMAGLGFEWRP